MKGRSENYRYTGDDVLLVRKVEQGWQGGFGGDYSRELWYQCSERNPDRQYLLMVLGGWFGLHKFVEGKLLQGFYYLLTCGCFGVFYLSDLIAMLLGDYFFKRVTYVDEGDGLERKMQKIYYGPVENRKSALTLLMAVVLLVLAVRFVYQPVGQNLLKWLAAAVSGNITEEDMGKILWMMQ